MERKPPLALRAVVFAVAAGLVVDPVAFAQQPSSATPQGTVAATGQQQAKTFSQKDLDELLAPIALYPDALLSQVLMASTYPLEVVSAARWQKENAGLKDKALEDALQKQDWDPSVKSLTSVPQVLTMMNEKLDWTTKLGDAFLAQQEDVIKTAQALRVKAEKAGTLKSSEQMTVKKETENNVQVIKIESPKPEVVYVPTVDPATAYGPWWYPAPPPYYYYPPGYAYGSGLAFATGVAVGAAIWGGAIGWGNNEINVNRNTNINTGNRNNIQGGNKWQHDPEHRKGAAYRDSGTAQKYNRGGQNTQAREQYRGRADQGRQQMSQMDRGELQKSAQAADRGGGQRGGATQTSARDAGGARGGDGGRGGGGGGASASRSGGSGFSGAGGGGASTRQASSRGASSMSRGGGGGGRGGGRR